MSEVLEAPQHASGPDFDVMRPLGARAAGGRPYRLYRNRSGAFWALPPGKVGRAAARALHSPQSALGELLGFAMRVGRLPVTRVHLDPDAVEELTARLAASTGLEAAVLAFMAGPPRPGNKFVVAVMSRAGRPVAFAKIAPSSAAREQMNAELGALRRLNTSPLAGRVPGLVDHFDWRGCHALVLAPGPSARGPKRPGSLHTEFLAALHDATGGSAPFDRTSTGAALEAAMRSPLLRPAERARYERVSTRLRAVFGDSDLPTTLAHRDFVPWNTRRSEEALWVYDWESARADALLLLDVFHFGFVRAALMGGQEPERWFAAAASRLWPESAPHLEDVRLAYLADVSWQYASRFGEHGYPRENPILTAAWSGIDRLLQAVPG